MPNSHVLDRQTFLARMMNRTASVQQSPAPTQPKESLRDFYRRHMCLVEQKGRERQIETLTRMARAAGYTNVTKHTTRRSLHAMKDEQFRPDRLKFPNGFYYDVCQVSMAGRCSLMKFLQLHVTERALSDLEAESDRLFILAKEAGHKPRRKKIAAGIAHLLTQASELANTVNKKRT